MNQAAWANVPYSPYPKASISLLATSAYWSPPKPGFLAASEKPKLGKLGAMTWKLGWAGDASVSSGSSFLTSRKCPGPVCAHDHQQAYCNQ